MLPVRCFTCGFIIGKYELKLEKVLSSMDNDSIRTTFIQSIDEDRIGKGLDPLRECCKGVILGYVPIYDKMMNYPYKDTEPEGKKSVRTILLSR